MWPFVRLSGGSRGSYTNTWSTTETWRYVTREGRWVTVAPMLRPRTNHTSATLNGEIYVIGGQRINTEPDVSSSRPRVDLAADLVSPPSLRDDGGSRGGGALRPVQRLVGPDMSRLKVHDQLHRHGVPREALRDWLVCREVQRVDHAVLQPRDR